MSTKKIAPYLKIFSFAAGVGSLLLGIVGANATQYPLEIQNCGRTLIFNKAPESVVSIGQSSTEILYLLNLSEKVKGTALWFSPVLPEYEQIDAQISRLADNEPSFEAVLAKRPELVTTQYEWAIGPMGVVATYEQFDEMKLPVYVSPTDCQEKDNLAGGDGLRTSPFTMELIYQEIAELAQIFDIEEQGATAIATLRAREQAAIDKVKNLPKDKISALFWFSSPDMNMDPYVAGRLGSPGYIMRTLGLRNIIESDFDWPNVGWETIARANPDIIVLADMTRRRYPADSIEAKREYLAKDPVARLMKAVTNNHLIAMDSQMMNDSIRTIAGIELLADALAKLSIE